MTAITIGAGVEGLCIAAASCWMRARGCLMIGLPCHQRPQGCFVVGGGECSAPICEGEKARTRWCGRITRTAVLVGVSIRTLPPALRLLVVFAARDTSDPDSRLRDEDSYKLLIRTEYRSALSPIWVDRFPSTVFRRRSPSVPALRWQSCARSWSRLGHFVQCDAAGCAREVGGDRTAEGYHALARSIARVAWGEG